MTLRVIAYLCICILISTCTPLKDKQTELNSFLPIESGYNVLIISFDALRADALGVYGYPKNTSPNIDKFAEQSLVFLQAHSAASSTPTSFAAAFTGEFPFRSFRGWQVVAKQTLAQIFRDAGYHTIFLSNNVQLVKKRLYNKGFDQYEVLRGFDNAMLEQAILTLGKIKDKKFFSWFHFKSPHAPYEFRPASQHLYDLSYRGLFQETSGGTFEAETPQSIKRLKDLYDGEVFYADSIFQKIISHITELNILSKTIIILTSDHGEEFGEHGGVQHNTLFNEGIQIPLIIRHPTPKKNGTTDIPFSNIDLLPTLSQLLDIADPSPVDGVNFFQGDNNDRMKISVSMTSNDKIEVSGHIETEKIILSCTPNKTISFFNLQTDPSEQNPLSDNEQRTEYLKGKLNYLMQGDPCNVISDALNGVSPEATLQKDQIKELKSLGYLK